MGSFVTLRSIVIALSGLVVLVVLVNLSFWLDRVVGNRWLWSSRAAEFKLLLDEKGHYVMGSSGEPLLVDREETEILKILSEHHEHVSFEKILSGPGLTALYLATSKLSGVGPVRDLAPSEIVLGAAETSNPICQRTLDIFCGILGSFAGNLCLTLGATGGVYVGGGVIEKIDQAGLFDQDRFLNRLAHKGRLSEWLGNIPAFLLRTPYAGLIGAAAALGIQNVSVIES